MVAVNKIYSCRSSQKRQTMVTDDDVLRVERFFRQRKIIYSNHVPGNTFRTKLFDRGRRDKGQRQRILNWACWVWHLGENSVSEEILLEGKNCIVYGSLNIKLLLLSNALDWIKRQLNQRRILRTILLISQWRKIWEIYRYPN